MALTWLALCVLCIETFHVVPRVDKSEKGSSAAQRTVLAGTVRMCVVTGLALVTLLLMTTKPGTLGPMWPLTSGDVSSQVTGNGSGERRELYKAAIVSQLPSRPHCQM